MAASCSADSHTPRQEILVEYMAGKMTMEGTTVKPDLRKGLLRLVRGEGLLHIQWMERTQDFPEDDIIVFPDEAVYEKVQQANGRVYILKFRQDSRKYFFWMQEPNVDGDAPLCRLVNFYIKHPQGFTKVDEDDEDYAITLKSLPENPQVIESSKITLGKDRPVNSDMSQSLGTGQGPVQLADLQRILSTIRPLETEAEATLARDTGPSLADILKPELVAPLLEICHLEERLAPFLPEGPWTPESIAELMQSPQFHQQVDAFTHVLRSGQIDLAQFGIDSSKYNFTVSSFLEAIEEQVTEKSGPSHVSIPEETDIQRDKGKDESPKKRSDDKNDPMEEGS